MQESQSVQEAAADATTKSNRSALLIVFLVVFIDLLGFGIVLPLLPRYGDDFLQDLVPGGKDSALGGGILGLLLSSFSLMQFIFAPLWGRISDRIGRRPILLLGLAGSVVFYTLFGFASDMTDKALGLTLLFIARTGAGIAGATISTAQAVIADCTPPKKRSHGMALIGMAFGIGFTFGPIIGALSLKLLPHFRGAPGFAAAGLSLIAAVLGFLLLPETWRAGSQAGRRDWLDWRGLQNALRMPVVGLLIVIFFLATFAFANFEATLSLVTKEAFNITDDDNYWIFAFVGFVLMIAQGLIYRRLAMRVKETAFMKVGLVLMIVGLAA
ncbi:MAG TPA: MFS transporter, partial [Gemmataceae bacterium]|nr:MFS transporter [Gemmataceae bacterium]